MRGIEEEPSDEELKPATEGPRMSSPRSDQTYRLHFSCENTGRYIRRSKRRIRWVFGFSRPKLETVKAGDCRGEEHDIELIWSVKSGKTRIFWNKCKISSIVREGGKSEVVEFTWKTKSNDVLKVIAHSSITSGADRQYDLLINGVSFSQLPTVSELNRRRNERLLNATETRCDSAAVRRADSCDSFGSIVPFDFPKEIGVPSSSSFRLSMAGLQSENMDDELRSELYSSALDEVRLSVTSFLPQTEEMLSRAIMDVFIGEDDTGHSSSSSSSSLCVPRDEECCHLELNALYETLEWTRLKDISGQDKEEMALAFLQKQITGTISQIRSEQITSQTAFRILVGVASLLHLPFARPMVQDTVIVEDSSHDINGRELLEFLSRFGVVERFSVSKKNRRFSFCRFAEEKSLLALLQAVRDNSLPEHVSQISFTALSNSAVPVATTEDSSTSELRGFEIMNNTTPEALAKPHLIKCVCRDQQTASSTCASPHSLYSVLDYSHFLLE